MTYSTLNLNIEGNLNIVNGITAGYVLATDGVGGTYWTSPPSGGTGPTGPTGPNGVNGATGTSYYPGSINFNSSGSQSTTCTNIVNGVYILGSELPFYYNAFPSIYRWKLYMTKTAAGTAQPLYYLRLGTAGTTADGALVTITGLAQTAATDTGFFELEVVITTTSNYWYRVSAGHHNSTTGIMNSNTPWSQVGTGTNITSGKNKIGLSINPGVSSTWTVYCSSESYPKL